MGAVETSPSPMRVALALGTLYLAWGGTYLAIRFAIETIPPLLMAGTRFLLAGFVLYTVLRLAGTERPRPAHWKSAAVVGACLLLGGNGAVSWAEQRVPSGLAALLVATAPFWMVLLDWFRPNGVWPGRRVGLGLLLGLVGVSVLVGPTDFFGGRHVDPIGAGVLLAGSMVWAFGSIYARQADLPASTLLATAMEMIVGGALLWGTGLMTGEWRHFDLSAISAKSLIGFAYLVVFGSWVGFSVYSWLLKSTTAARVATYAYVNPIVAVLLGWFVAGEPLTPRVGGAVVC
ncbi:MAG: EamA family transporter, partial [Acidobacteriota bacterium]|nr:EamA family transporter [Acidobacteriota bacterium]